MIRAFKFLGLLLVFAFLACTLDPDEDDGPDTRTAARDPRCPDGGTWNGTACEFPDPRPPAGPRLSTGG